MSDPPGTDSPSLTEEPAMSSEELAPVYASTVSTLRYGFLLAAGLFAAGVIWSLIAQEELASEVMPVQDIPDALADGSPMAVIDLAFLALMMTPVVTVLRVSMAFFSLGDRRFGAASLVVLGILGTGVALALAR
jgi:uncharacterized membrane protein